MRKAKKGEEVLDHPGKFHSNSFGPPLTIQIHVHEEQITQTVLCPHAESGMSWQLVSDHTYPQLEKLLGQWFHSYCHGEIFTKELPLNWNSVSHFTFEVLKVVAKIPLGQLLSYQELAIKIGKPKGTRAVGAACGRNPFPWIIPCHRVVASGGGLGGYSLDLLIKRRLLEYEQASPKFM